ncbi:Clp1/GlmU family protein [Sulfolobus acidocaldarius]|uniref:Clp1/GlmU family protein n=1 Tax=Sulfolobus acidocaldarius TaxID=2285 RepID=UPI001E57E4CE|nr:Clp1/GlmU family protein [Sulfolobus acidocaldarius]
MIKLDRDTDLVIKGPCVIRINSGKISVNGIVLIEGQLDIHENDTFTLTSMDVSSLDSNCEILSKYPTLGWHKIINDLDGRIIILGKQNSGKTYLSNMLLNMHGGKIIDADVGQSSLFLPTFVSISSRQVEKKLKLSERAYESIEFFGDITPLTNPRLHISLIDKLYNMNKDEKNLVIDADGWINGFSALKHKLELIYRLDPDYILVFNEKILSDLPIEIRRKVKIIKPFPLDVNRNIKTRKMYRKNKYRSYFSKSLLVDVDIREILGSPLSKNLLFAWGEEVQLIDEQPCQGYYIEREEIIGLIVGLLHKGKIAGAGLIKQVDEVNQKVTIQSPITAFDGVILGSIALNNDYDDCLLYTSPSPMCIRDRIRKDNYI